MEFNINFYDNKKFLKNNSPPNSKKPKRRRRKVSSAVCGELHIKSSLNVYRSNIHTAHTKKWCRWKRKEKRTGRGEERYRSPITRLKVSNYIYLRLAFHDIYTFLFTDTHQLSEGKSESLNCALRRNIISCHYVMAQKNRARDRIQFHNNFCF